MRRIVSCILLAVMISACANDKTAQEKPADATDSLKMVRAGDDAGSDVPGLPSVLNTWEDSLRAKYAIDDSITIIGKHYEYDQLLYSFIIHRKDLNSVLKDKPIEFSQFDRKQYDDIYWRSKGEAGQKEIIDANVMDAFAGRWIKLREYKGNFYVNFDCEFNRSWYFNDSTFISHDMDGHYPDVITRVDQDNDRTIVHTHKGHYTFEPVAMEEGIYKLRHGDDFNYVIRDKYRNRVDEIVDECPWK